MASRPWIKFFPADWQADQALGVCSLAARGFWMELLAIMHRADPYGFLLVNGKAPNDAQLASLARCLPDQIPSLLDELENAGVFSRTRTGVIYSRRLTRDEKQRRDGEQSAKSGTLPNSRRGRQKAEKKEENPPPMGVDEGVVSKPPSPHKPEAISQKEKTLYAWQGRVGRLTEPDLLDWRRQFTNLDDAEFRRELMKADAYYTDHPPKDGKWFYPFHRWLDKADADAGTRPKKRAHPAFGTPEWARAQVEAGITLEPQYEHLLEADRARQSGG